MEAPRGDSEGMVVFCVRDGTMREIFGMQVVVEDWQCFIHMAHVFTKIVCKV